MQILQHPHLHQTHLSLSPLSLLPNFSSLSLRRPTFIRMGGGPRTYPGGVSKWQWKRMQAKKAKQLLKARLCRERQIYEMRKRAELTAAVAELERPWEVVERAAPQTALFSVGADEQLKVLADRFQKPGGFDMWSEDDGPQLFETPDGLPTARFFPKGVVHSVKPYGRIGDSGGNSNVEDEGSEFDGLRNLRGRRNGKLGSEGFDREDSDFSGLMEFNGGESEGDRDIHNLTSDGQREISRSRVRNLRGRRNGSFVGGSEGFDGEDSDFSGLTDFNGGDSGGGRDVNNFTHDAQRRISRGRLRNLRGQRSGSFVGGSEGFDGEDSDFLGLTEFNGGDSGGGRDVHNLSHDGQRGISRGGFRNSRGRRNGRNGRNSGRRLGNGSFVGVNEMSNGEVSCFSGADNGIDRRWGKNRSGSDYKRNGNGMAFRSEDRTNAKVMDSEGRNPSSGMRSGNRRFSARGRNAGRSSKRSHSEEDVYDLSLRRDGSYGFSVNEDDPKLSSPMSRR